MGDGNAGWLRGEELLREKVVCSLPENLVHTTSLWMSLWGGHPEHPPLTCLLPEAASGGNTPLNEGASLPHIRATAFTYCGVFSSLIIKTHTYYGRHKMQTASNATAQR